MQQLIIKLISAYLNLTAPLFPKYNGELIFKLVCKVNSPPLKPKTRAFFDSGTTTMLPNTYKDVALHSWGSGSKNILFLHGWRSNAKQWQPYVDHLDLSEYTVYALDAPSHGASPGNHLNLEIYREAVNSAVNTIGNVHCTICHSLGSLAMSYAYLYNPKINIDSYIIMGAPAAMQEILVYSEKMLSLSRKASQNLRNKINTIIKVPIEEVTLERFFEKVKQPTFVVHETSDDVTPAAVIKNALEGKSHVQSLFTQGQDHMLKGQETIDAVAQFITHQKRENYVL